MDVWGSGNLDGDAALEAISSRSQELVGKVWEGMKALSSANVENPEHWVLLVHIEWLFSLERVALFSGLSLPSVDEFDSTSTNWLSAWSAQNDSKTNQDFYLERKGVLLETLTELRAVCEKYEKRRKV